MTNKTQGLFFGVLGAVLAGVVLWAIKSFFPATVNWLFTPDVPKGAIMAFAQKKCPDKSWIPFEDAEGRFILGWSSNSNLPNQETRILTPFDDTGGSKSVTLSLSQIPSHRHVTNNATSHVYSPFGWVPEVHSGLGGTAAIGYKGYSLTKAEGGNEPHTNMPPYIALTYCKKI